MKVSRDFYENLLGQKVKFDYGENLVFEGDFAIHLEDHFKNLLGEKHNMITKKSGNFELYFEEAEIDTLYEKLKNHVVFIHGIQAQPWGQKVMRFYDPDFHIIEIGEPMEELK